MATNFADALPAWAIIAYDGLELKYHLSIRSVVEGLQEGRFFRADGSLKDLNLFLPPGSPINAVAVMAVFHAHLGGCDLPELEPLPPFHGWNQAYRQAVDQVNLRNRPVKARWRKAVSAELEALGL